MKKKMIALMMVIAILMTGCGNKVVTNTSEEDTESVTTSNISNTNEATENSEDVISDIPEKDIESSINEELENLNLKEYKDSFEDRDIDTGGTPVFHLRNLKPVEMPFI